MYKQLQQVKEFQKTFGSGCGDYPQLISPETTLLRFELMSEENQEYLQAAEQQNLTEVADALGDMLYVLCGTILEHGLPEVIEEVFSEIHRSNMSKTDENGKPIINGENGVMDKSRTMGKVLKSKRYSKPNLQPIIDKAHESKKGYIILELLRERELLKEMQRGAIDFSAGVEYGQRIDEIDSELEDIVNVPAGTQFIYNG